MELAMELATSSNHLWAGALLGCLMGCICTPILGYLTAFVSVKLRMVQHDVRGNNVDWAANKSFEISKFKFKFPRARTFELFRAHRSLISIFS